METPAKSWVAACPRPVAAKQKFTDAPHQPLQVKNFDCILAMKALGEESRLRIVRMLLKKQCSVNEVAEALDITQYNVSKHLRVLREAGLIEQEKNGQQRLYSLAPAFTAHLAEKKNVLDLGCCQFDFSKLPR
jgi:DNA-binding transcriptional ArsR family regulator